MPPPLLRTKLYFPAVRLQRVFRPRLVERLQTGLQGPLTLVSAPAGYGKTTLLSEWRAGVGRQAPAAWLSLDAGDNDPARFLQYLATALDGLQDGLLEDARSLLQAPQLPPIEAVLTALLNALASFPEDFVLVLDDYHLITEPALHAALQYILDHQPPVMHLVLLTRADPPLPLARLRAHGQLVEIRARDLRFTTVETAAFLTQVMALRMEDAAVQRLEARTEGWVAGLQLAGLSLQGRSRAEAAAFLDAFAEGHDYILDYLADEVLNRLSPEVQAFLLKTSILERLCGPLCDFLMEGTGGQIMLEQLLHANVFLVPLDDIRCWYRYHHLFAAVLQKRLAQLLPGQATALHGRAARWFDQHSEPADAFFHAAQAGDLDLAARLVEQHAMPMWLRGEFATILKWTALVEGLAPARPWISIYKAWALATTNRYAEVEPALAIAESTLASTPASEDARQMRAHIASVRVYYLNLQGDTERSIWFSDQVWEHLSENDTVLRSIFTFFLGYAHWTRNQVREAVQFFEESRSLCLEAGNLYLAVSAVSSLGVILNARGQLRQAVERYTEALQLSIRSDGRLLPVAGRTLTNLSFVLYEQNKLDEAENCLQQALEVCQASGQVDPYITACVLLAKMRWTRGDLAEMEKRLVEAETALRFNRISRTTRQAVEAERTRLWLAQGNLEACLHWAEESGLGVEDDLTNLNEMKYVALVRVWIAHGQLEAAEALTIRLLARAEGQGRTARLIELYLLRALAHQAQGDRPGAARWLEQSLLLAEPAGYVRMYVDEGRSIVPLLADLQRQTGTRTAVVPPDYLRKLVEQIAAESAAPPETPQTALALLSERELEVLRLVAAGCTNQQIAGQLVIALGTVKRHTANIFDKLDVYNRTEAVARARELGLL